MLEVKSWRIYYADDSTFDSTMGTWAEAPAFGVQCVVYYHVGGRKTYQVEGKDRSVYEYLGDEAGGSGVKLGLWMDNEGYFRVLDNAGGSLP
jgi:hypothetical protein